MTNHILIVEDSPTNLLLIKTTLNEAGYIIETASDGLLALQQTRANPPELIILDIELPNINGYEVCKQIKADNRLKDIPVLFISGHDNVDEKVKAFEIGGVDYITKPFQKAEIIARVKTHLELKRLREKDQARIEQLSLEIDEHKRTEVSLLESRALYQHIVQAAQEGIWLIDEKNITTFVNAKMAEMLGYTIQEMIGKSLFNFMDEQGVRHNIEQGKYGFAKQTDFEFIKKDGSRLYVMMGTTPIIDDEGIYKGALVGVVDMTERRQAELTQKKANRMLTMISKCNASIMKHMDETALFNDICQIIEQEGGYPLVWVGLALDDAAHTVKTAAYGGEQTAEYLESIKITWDDSHTGQGPAGTAIRTLTRQINRDTLNNPAFAPWVNLAIKHNLRSSIALPLISEGKALGALNIYSHEADAFDEHEASLLSELANDLSHGIRALRTHLEHMQAQQHLRKWGHIFEYARWGIGVSSGATIDMLNPELARMCGYTVEELQGKPVIQLYPEKYHAQIPVYLQESEDQGYVSYIAEYLHKDGHSFPVWVNVNTVKDDGDEWLYRVAHVQDITNLKAAEKELRLSDEILRQLTSAIIMTDLEGHIQRWMGSAKQIFGYTHQEAIGQPIHFIYQQGFQAERSRQIIESTLRNGLYMGEVPCVHKNGQQVLIETTVQTILDESGKPIALISINKDITSRKKMEIALQKNTDQLRASEERLRRAMNIARLGIWEWDIETGETTWSGDMFRIYGITPEEFTGNGTDYIEFTHPDDRAAQRTTIQKDFEQAQKWLEQGLDPLEMTQPNPHQLRIIRSDGSICTVLGDAIVMANEQGEMSRMIGVLLDITNIKQAEEKIRTLNAELKRQVTQQSYQLQQEQEQIAIILQNVTDAIFLADHEGKLIYVNPAWEMLTGYRQADVDEESIKLLQYSQIEEEKRRFIWDTLYSGQVWRDTIQSKRKDGTLYDNDITIAPVKSNDNEIHNFVGVQHDVTKARELAYMKERFIADAAHDLGSPITSLAMRLEMLKRKPEDLDRHVSLLEHQIKHLHDLVKDLLTLSQLDRNVHDIDLAIVNFNSIISQVVETQEPVAIHKNLKLTFIPENKNKLFLMDAKQIERAVINLVTNAINYTPDGGEITLETEYTDEWGILTIEDTGIGIGPQELPHIFKRFYRSSMARSTTTGTGLGLPIVQEIINTHQGKIYVSSDVGKGTKIKIYLPIKEKP